MGHQSGSPRSMGDIQAAWEEAATGAVWVLVWEVKPRSQGPRAGGWPGWRHSPCAPCWLRVGSWVGGAGLHSAAGLSVHLGGRAGGSSTPGLCFSQFRGGKSETGRQGR